MIPTTPIQTYFFLLCLAMKSAHPNIAERNVYSILSGLRHAKMSLRANTDSEGTY